VVRTAVVHSTRTFDVVGGFGVATGTALPVPVVRRTDQVVGDDGAVRLWTRLTVGTVGTFVWVAALTLAAVATLPLLVGYSAVVVSSASMEPALYRSDVVVTASPQRETPDVGAVIDFGRGAQRMIHRVVEVRSDGYITRGDANRSPDSDLVPASAVRGVGILVVPLVGVPRLWLDDGQMALVAALSTVLVGGAWVSRREWVLG
jgi:signal peptidase I